MSLDLNINPKFIEITANLSKEVTIRTFRSLKWKKAPIDLSTIKNQALLTSERKTKLYQDNQTELKQQAKKAEPLYPQNKA
jgi:hypothetical protein